MGRRCRARSASEPADTGLPASLPKDAARTVEALARGSLWIYAAEVQGRFAGYVSATQAPKPDGRVCLYVDELWVAEPYRRRGLARALLAQVDRLGKELGVWRIRLVVGAENEEARQLYAAAGYIESPAYFCEKILSGF